MSDHRSGMTRSDHILMAMRSDHQLMLLVFLILFITLLMGGLSVAALFLIL
jgi:hypothetical protein